MIPRFIRSFQFPEGVKVNILKVKELRSGNLRNKRLELYHTPRVDNIIESVNNITKFGFRICSPYNNKGMGVYLSSSARYQYLWLGDTNPIIVCEIQDVTHLKRFKAEIPPGYEYVAANPDVVIPKYLIDYKITGFNGKDNSLSCGYEMCDVCKDMRCDCELKNVWHPQENILK